MFSPLLLYPTLNRATLLGSDAGKRKTWLELSDTQMRSWPSIARWNGAVNDLHGSALSPSQTMRPLVQSPLGNSTNWRVEMPSAHTSPPGVTMTPCISPRRPLKLIPSGGVSGLPLLSNTAIDLPP